MVVAKIETMRLSIIVSNLIVSSGFLDHLWIHYENTFD